MKILILKPSSLGDVIQALPVLRMLRLHRLDSRIYWWVARELAPLLQDDPDLAGIFPFDRQQWMLPGRFRELLRNVSDVRDSHFDWVIDLQGLARSGTFAWLANARFTIGVEDPREGASLFYDERIPRPTPQTHAVDWYLNVLQKLGVPLRWDFEWMPVRSDTKQAIQRKWGVASSRWVALVPGARWRNKQWPVAHYADLVRRLSREDKELRFVILGTASDQALADTIAAGSPDRCLDLTGQTTLTEMIEWLRLCSVVITNDTGPMHIAAALKRPIVALFGPTDPRRTGPYGQLDQVLRVSLPCSPCLRPQCHYEKPLECLNLLTSEMAFQASLRHLVP